MHTARIVVLTIAVGVVGVAAACLARGAVSNGFSSGISSHVFLASLLGGAEFKGDPLLLALSVITASNILRAGTRGEQAFRRGDSTAASQT